MKIGCYQACACVTSCWEATKQAFAATMIKCDEVRRDPEALQKACIVALSAIRSINIHCRTNYLPNLVEVLDSAPFFDLYGCTRLPRLFFHPWTAASIDEFTLLDQLEVILCDNWHLGSPDSQGKSRDSQVKQFAKAELTAFLETLQEEGLDFRTEKEVINILHNWLEKRLESHPVKDFDPHVINLKGLKVKLKKVSWIDFIITWNFAAIDILCVPDFLQGWNVIDLSSITESIGKIPVLGSANKYTLDEWISGMWSFGHGLYVIDASYSLLKGGLSPAEAKSVKWTVVASTAESIYALSILLKKNHAVINSLALIAKSLGLVAFIVAEKPTYFYEA